MIHPISNQSAAALEQPAAAQNSQAAKKPEAQSQQPADSVQLSHQASPKHADAIDGDGD